MYMLLFFFSVLFIHLFIYGFLHLFIYFFIYLSIYLFIYLFTDDFAPERLRLTGGHILSGWFHD